MVLIIQLYKEIDNHCYLMNRDETTIFRRLYILYMNGTHNLYVLMVYTQ